MNSLAEMCLPAAVLIFCLNAALISLEACAIATVLGRRTVWSLPVRHALLVAALGASLLAPVAMPLFPSVWAITDSARVEQPQPAAAVPLIESLHRKEALELSAEPAVPLVEIATDRTAGIPSTTISPVSAVVEAIRPASSRERQSLTTGEWARAMGTLICGIWFVGLAVGLERTFAGLAKLQGWLQTVSLAESPLLADAARAAADGLGFRQTPAIYRSNLLPAPVSFGLFRPRIVVPAGLESNLTPDQLRAVIRHEMAHIARRDTWIGLLQQVAAIVYWWNPLVLLVNRQLDDLREQICDDIAIPELPEPAAYAATLIMLAERSSLSVPVPATLGIGSLRAGQLEKRIRRIMSSSSECSVRLTPRSVVNVTAAAVVLMTATILCAQVRVQSPAKGELPRESSTAAPAVTLSDDGQRLAEGPPDKEQGIGLLRDRLGDVRRERTSPLVSALKPVEAGARLDAAGEPLPTGMIQRLGSTRFKVPGWWRRLAFAGNDEWIWIKADSRLSVIHRESGRIVKQHQLGLGDQYVGSVTASPDGTRVAIGISDNSPDADRRVHYRVVVMSAQTTEHLQDMTWQARVGDLTGLSFNGDGKTLLTAIEDNDLRLWNVETGELLRQQHIERARSRHAALSADGSLAVLGGWDGAFLWNIEANADPIKFLTKQGDSVCFAPNGKMFATIAPDGARLWNAATGEQVALLEADDERAYADADFGIAFTPDNRLLAVPAHTGNRIDLWDVESKQRTATLPVRHPRGLAISRNGRWLAASGDEQFTAIFDMQTHQQVNQPGDGHVQEVASVRFANAATLVTSSGGDARVWDVKTGRQQLVLPHESSRVTVRGLAASLDGNLIVTSAFDDTLGVWERKTGKRVFTLQGHGRTGSTRQVRFTPDDSQFVSWGDDGVLRRWNAKDCSLAAAHTLDLPGYSDPSKGAGRFPAVKSAMSPDSRLLFVWFDQKLFEFDTATGKQLRQAPFSRRMAPLAISPDGQWIAAGEIHSEPDGKTTAVNVVLRDLATLEVVREWPVSDPGNDLNTAVPDPVNSDGPNDGKKSPKPPISFVAQNDTAIVFSPDSKLLAWSRLGAQPGIDIVEIQQDRVLASIPVESPCWCLEFSPDGSLIASGHSDSTISVWSWK
jgi:WD40 repeat protein/beta-lactamase regulating signal transducer with metallopeptidase domain